MIKHTIRLTLDFPPSTNATHPEEAPQGARSRRTQKATRVRTAPPTRGRPFGKKKFAFSALLRLPFCSFPAAHLLSSGCARLGLRCFPLRKGQRRAYNPGGSSLRRPPSLLEPSSSAALADEQGTGGKASGGGNGSARSQLLEKPASARASKHLLSRRAGISLPRSRARLPRCTSRSSGSLPRAARLARLLSLFAPSCGRRRPSTCLDFPPTQPPPRGGVTCREENLAEEEEARYARVRVE